MVKKPWPQVSDDKRRLFLASPPVLDALLFAAVSRLPIRSRSWARHLQVPIEWYDTSVSGSRREFATAVVVERPGPQAADCKQPPGAVHLERVELDK